MNGLLGYFIIIQVIFNSAQETLLNISTKIQIIKKIVMTLYQVIHTNIHQVNCSKSQVCISTHTLKHLLKHK